MRHPGVLPALLFALCGPVAVLAPARAQEAASAAPAIVITSMPDAGTATLNAGANAGLSVGMELRVQRDGREVGRIVLSQVETDTSTGRVTPADGESVRVADAVGVPAHLDRPAAVSPAPAPPAPRPEPAVNPRKAPRSDYSEHADDIIPWERWEYMALSSLAADGLVPGYSARDFQATRQFTRRQLADLTARALVAYAAGAGSDRSQVFLRRLAQEFRLQPPVKEATAAIAEIDLPRTPSAVKPSLPQVPGLSVYGGPRFTRFQGDDKLSFAGRVGGIVDLGPKAFAALSLTNLHRLTSALPKDFTAVDVATVNARLWDADWELGKTYWSSGPVYSGDGLLSDNAPGMLMLKGRKQFSWGKLGRFTLTQIYGGFEDFDNHKKYYGLRRIEARIARRLDLGLGEAYVATRAPNPLSLVLPYYAYQRAVVFKQKIGGHSGSAAGNDTFNYMAQVDLYYHWRPKMAAYVELVVDDISAPSGLGVGNVPRKTAFVLGMHFPHMFGGRGEGRFEIYNSDRETYLGIAPQVGWNEKYLLLGSPFGPNTQAFFGRLDYRFSPKLKAWVQLRDAVQFHNGLPDVGDRFEMAMAAAYDLTPSQSVSVRWVPQRFRGQGYVLRPNAFELMGTYAY